MGEENKTHYFAMLKPAAAMPQRYKTFLAYLSKPTPFNRDPYFMHLNIALYMVVSLYFGRKSHVSNGQHVSFKEPCLKRRPQTGNDLLRVLHPASMRRRPPPRTSELLSSPIGELPYSLDDPMERALTAGFRSDARSYTHVLWCKLEPTLTLHLGPSGKQLARNTATSH